MVEAVELSPLALDWFKKNKLFVGPDTKAYVMPRERSIDIDDSFDFAVAGFLLSNSNVTNTRS
jgi:N-acylneuraminate cytidylyltransferase/CMP-N,N'-diacetyllegionaminic acid synthase